MTATGLQNLVTIDRQGVPLELSDALPLRTGDLLWIDCKLPAGWGASVFWFDSEGRLTELTPIGRTEDGASQRISYPAAGATTLVGPPGTEFILVCARPSSPPRIAEVVGLFPDGQPWPSFPENESILLDRDRVAVTVPSKREPIIRGAGANQSSAARKLVETLESLRIALAGKFEFVAGVSFPHRSVSPEARPIARPSH